MYFETIRCEDFEVFNLNWHKRRIADTVSFNINLEEYIYPPSEELLKCKVLYDCSGIIDIEYTPYIPKDIKSFKIVYDDGIDYKYKTVDRENINKLYEKKENRDEIIIIKNDFVTDTSIANIAILVKDQWYTPKIPLLNGTTRQRYIESGILKEYDIDLGFLLKSEKIALLNAMIDFKTIENFEIIL